MDELHGVTANLKQELRFCKSKYADLRRQTDPIKNEMQQTIANLQQELRYARRRFSELLRKHQDHPSMKELAALKTELKFCKQRYTTLLRKHHREIGFLVKPVFKSTGQSALGRLQAGPARSANAGVGPGKGQGDETASQLGGGEQKPVKDSVSGRSGKLESRGGG
jgi:hypothetical protein